MIRKLILLALLLPGSAVLAAGSPSQPQIIIQTGHHKYHPSCAAFTPSGKNIVTGANDCSIQLWDVATGKMMRTFRGHTMFIDAVSVSPDGTMIASAASEEPVMVWDIVTGNLIRSLPVQGAGSRSVAFSPDGRTIAVSANNIITIWSVTGALLHSMDDPDGASIWSVAFSPDALKLASSSDNGAAHIWETATGKHLQRLAGKGWIRMVSWAPSGSELVGCSPDLQNPSIALWNTTNGEKLWEITEPEHHTPYSATASSCGRFILASYADGLTIYDSKSGRLLTSHSYITTAYRNNPKAILSPDGKTVFSCGDMNLRKTMDGTLLKSFRSFSSTEHAYILSFDNTKALSASGRTAHLWDLQEGKPRHVLNGHNKIISSVGISMDGSLLLTADFGGTVRLWSGASGKELKIFQGHKSSVNRLQISRNNNFVVSCSEDGLINVWNCNSGSLRWSSNSYSEAIASLAISPDSRLIATSQRNDRSRLQIWDAATGQSVISLQSGDARHFFATATFSPDSSTVYAWDYMYNYIVSWDIASGKRINSYKAYFDKSATGSRYHVLLSVDGRHILSYDEKGARILCDINNNRELLRFSRKPIGESSLPADFRRSLKLNHDGSITLISVPDEKRIFSFISDEEGRWASFTDDGYWDASPDGSDLLAVSIGMQCWLADQFAVRTNRPDIISARLSAPKEIRDHLTAQYRKRLSRMNIRESNISRQYRVPVTLLRSVRQEGKIAVINSIFTADSAPLKSYQIYCNGVALFPSGGKTLSGRKAECTDTVELTSGRNILEVSCIDSGGTESYRASEILVWNEKTSHDLYFVAFGISEYRDPSIRDLSFAAKDARDLEAYFSTLKGKTYRNVSTLVFTDSQAVKQSLSQARAFIAGAKPDDTCIIFIAGHGIQMPDKSPGSSSYFYIAHDTALDRITESGIRFEEIESLLNGIAPRQKLFLMDTCESGEADPAQSASGSYTPSGASARTLAPETVRALRVIPGRRRSADERNRYLYNDLIRRSGAVIFSSSKGSEASLEFSHLKQGAFTHMLLEALQSRKADANGDGSISLQELRDYVIREVPRITDDQQHPTVDRDNIHVQFGF